MSPPITATAIGERKLESDAPQPKAMGTMPAPMAMVVMTMGRARLLQASTMASSRDMPCTRWASMAYSTKRMEFLVAMPMSMIKPINEGMENALSATSKPTNAPPNDSGSAARMVKGCKNALNSSTSTM